MWGVDSSGARTGQGEAQAPDRYGVQSSLQRPAAGGGGLGFAACMHSGYGARGICTTLAAPPIPVRAPPPHEAQARSTHPPPVAHHHGCSSAPVELQLGAPPPPRAATAPAAAPAASGSRRALDAARAELDCCACHHSPGSSVGPAAHASGPCLRFRRIQAQCNNMQGPGHPCISEGWDRPRAHKVGLHTQRAQRINKSLTATGYEVHAGLT